MVIAQIERASQPIGFWVGVYTMLTHLSARRIIAVNDIGLHGATAMRVQVKKWGNSASVRIPAAIMQAANLKLDAAVDVREEDGRIVVEPLGDEHGDLDALLARITPQNLHGESDFGSRVGKELL